MKGRINASRQAKKLLSQIGFDPDKYDINKHDGCAVDIEGIVKSLNIKLLPSDLSENISGVFFRSKGDLYLGYNKHQHVHRQRFTIAHEIGHYRLHASENLHYDKDEVDSVYFRSNDVSNSEEIEANQFAAEILIPEALVDKCIAYGITAIDKLATRFNVSESAMRYRLINLGYL